MIDLYYSVYGNVQAPFVELTGPEKYGKDNVACMLFSMILKAVSGDSTYNTAVFHKGNNTRH